MNTKKGTRIVLDKLLDDDGVEYTMQESSAAESPHIWLGIIQPEVIIRYKDAVECGLDLKKKFSGTNEYGWCDFPIPEKALIKSRIHLNQKQAKELGNKLLKFAKTGEV